MSVKTTSLIAFIGIQSDGTARTLRGKVYNAIAANPGKTRQELSFLTRIPINSLCGRTRELLDAGVLYENAPVSCSMTGNMAAPLHVMMTGRNSFMVKVKKRTIKDAERELKIATDALTKIALYWHSALANQTIAKDALDKIGGTNE